MIPKCVKWIAGVAGAVLLSGVADVNAGQSNLRFHHHSLEQGLSQEAVTDIVQSRQGYMWFATQEGLNRFDGHQFVVYNHEKGEDNSLSHDAINTLAEDPDGNIWIGTLVGGIDRFDPVSQAFTHFRQSTHGLSSDKINVLFFDHRGTLWVGTDDAGINRWDPQASHFLHYRMQEQSQGLNSDVINAIAQDANSVLWVGTESGLHFFDAKNNRFNHVQQDSHLPEALKSGAITSIFSDEQRNLWVGTYSQGLFKIASQGALEHYAADLPEGFCDNWVRDIRQDERGNLWVATNNGLCLLPYNGRRFVALQHQPGSSVSISDNRTISLYQDRGGVLWMGTYGGINRWTLSDFEHYRQGANSNEGPAGNIITSFSDSASGDVWVGTYEGLSQFDPVDKTFTEITALGGLPVMSLHQDERENALWIGTQNSGLYQYFPHTASLVNFRQSQDPTSISGNGITDIFQSDDGRIWVSVYEGGLNLLNADGSGFRHFLHDEKLPNSLSSNRILKIYQSRDGFFWLGTEGGGLNRFNAESGEFMHFRHEPDRPDSLSSDIAWSILEDSRGDLWIGTWGGGLNRWRNEDRLNGKASFEHFGKKQGLPSSVIYDILEDPDNRLWLSTNRGLTRFDPDSGKVLQYDVSHGLQDNEFNLNAALISRKGELYFGGSNGFNRFRSEHIQPNTHAPQVVLNTIQKLNKRSGTVNLPLNADSFEFGYQDYVVTFDFAGLDFTAPQKNRYQYMLEGFDLDWVELGASRRATFTNLPDGNYTLRIKASNNDGVWSEQGIALPVTVTPPPWRSWWAYALYATLIAGIVFAIYRAQARKLREKAEYSRELEEQVSLRTSQLTEANAALEVAKAAAEAGNQSKGTFIATMSHELRTPMTAIIGYAQSMLEDTVDVTETQRRSEKIIRNAVHLLQLLNNVLDVSKIEQQKLELEHIAISPCQLLGELEELIGQQARQKDLAFSIHYLCPLPEVIYGDPTRVKQVLINLCNNAIKFTETGSIRVSMSANRLTNRLHFSVLDTGIGIPQEKVATVFEAFNQADSSTTRKYGGTGLGLSICQALVEAMGGDIQVTSQRGEGSEFAFYIDMGSADSLTWIDNEEQIQALQQHRSESFDVPRLSGQILLAEDWPDNQELICMYIKRTGASVTLVENGQQAVEQALAGEFDLILMDVQMPEMDGIEATQMLRAVGYSRPIVALTANVSQADIEHYLQSGMDSHLSKPIERDAFYQCLSNHLEVASQANSEDTQQHHAEYQALLAQFIENRLPEVMAALEQAVAEPDTAKVKALLHNLKGMGGSFGFPQLTDIAERYYDGISTAVDLSLHLAPLRQCVQQIRQQQEDVL